MSNGAPTCQHFSPRAFVSPSHKYKLVKEAFESQVNRAEEKAAGPDFGISQKSYAAYAGYASLPEPRELRELREQARDCQSDQASIATMMTWTTRCPEVRPG